MIRGGAESCRRIGADVVALHERGAHVVHYDWAPVAGGDPRLQALLESLG